MNETPKLNAALAALQTQLPRIAKDQTANVPTKAGGSYRYTYADLAQVSAEVLPLLGKHELAFMARPTVNEKGEFVLAYELRHASGEAACGEYLLPDPRRVGPQEVGSAITYARRYTLCSVTGVAPDDDDNDAAVAERNAQRRSRREQTRTAREAAAPGPTVTAKQKRQMQDGFAALGITDPASRVQFVAEALKRQITSASQLTQSVDADVVIAALEKKAAAKRGDGDDQEAWLAAQQPPDGVGEPA